LQNSQQKNLKKVKMRYILKGIDTFYEKELGMIRKNVSIFVAAIATIAFFCISKADASTEACDRECLKGFITQYLDALTAKTPDVLPLDANVKFTENCKTLKVGEGFWKDINGTVRYRLDVIDVNQSGAGALVVIKGTASALFAVRLKIKNRKITEIETMVTKNSTEGMIFNPDGFKAPPADSDMTIVPKTELLNTREEMIATASKYPEAMKQKLANFNKNGLYFTKGAYRLENGTRMAGPGCTMGSGCENVGQQGLPGLPEMAYKPALIDEQAGIAMLRLNFGKGSVMSGSGNLDVFEAFKIYNDSMHCIYAIMYVVPAGTTFGWDYTTVGAKQNPSRKGGLNTSGNIAVTPKGVSIRLAFARGKVIVDVYDVAGKLVHTQAAAYVPKNNEMFLPMDLKALPPGHFFGCVRCITGDKTANSLLFDVNTIR
jgi:hypothetical protein